MSYGKLSLKKILTFRLYSNNVVVLFGRSEIKLNLKGPYEQISRVDCLQELYTFETVLLHLETPVTFNRYCLPTYLPFRFDNQ